MSFLRAFFLVALGFVLCAILGLGFHAYKMWMHPLEGITNRDYPSVEVTGEYGAPSCVLGRGETKLLPYGEYKINIPDAKVSFVLFKNNRGACYIYSANGLPLIEVNENASVEGALR